jgi:predicted ATP-grasp superfamily ATP-dependent carboligase
LNHNTYAFIAQSCGLGEVISNVSAIADQSGGIVSGSIGMYFYNSRLIVWNGGSLGVNIATIAADPATGSSALSGLNSILNMNVRSDLTNLTIPSIGSGAPLGLKGNVTASGSWAGNN